MPYYSTIRSQERVESYQRNLQDGSQTVGNPSVRGSSDLSFRSFVPTGEEVREIALNIAEPYSWFVDLQEMKIKALKSEGRFDPSLFLEDTGHNWYNKKWVIGGQIDFVEKYTSSLSLAYKNCVFNATSAELLYPSLGVDSLATDAAQWYGRMAPVVGDFSLSTFLGELREGLPRLIPDFIRKAHFAKSVGSDYLNVEFGWKPLLNDLQQLAEGLFSASLGLYRPWGATHRRRELKPITTFSRDELGSIRLSAQFGDYSQLIHGGQSVGLAGNLRAFQANTVRTVKTSREQWFEGTFVYIPKASFDPSNFLDRMETLMDVNLTPSTLWNLAPWSWLVDWSNNIGASIAAMEAGMSNRIMSTYFYGMETFKSSVDTTFTNLGSSSGRVTDLPYFHRQLSSVVTKRRLRGNPFGYSGNSSSALDVQQMGILAALGLTKSR